MPDLLEFPAEFLERFPAATVVEEMEPCPFEDKIESINNRLSAIYSLILDMRAEIHGMSAAFKSC